MHKTSLDILDNGMDMNFGSIFENAVAQELTAHGFDLHYYNSKKFGEVVFVISDKNDTVFPIEVKSGKDYTRHKALGKILDVGNYHLEKGYVLGSTNVSVEGKIVYLPVYMVGLFESE